VAAEIAEETARDLHAEIEELAIANDFLSRKLKPWTGKRGEDDRTKLSLGTQSRMRRP
jgi:hypothetical protein